LITSGFGSGAFSRCAFGGGAVLALLGRFVPLLVEGDGSGGTANGAVAATAAGGRVLVLPSAVMSTIALQWSQFTGVDSGHFPYLGQALSLAKCLFDPHAKQLSDSILFCSFSNIKHNWLGFGRVCVQPPRRPYSIAATGSASIMLKNT